MNATFMPILLINYHANEYVLGLNDTKMRISNHLRGKQRNETMFEVNFNMQIGHINTTNMFWKKIFYNFINV